jgi:hypothetical protein
MPKQRQPLHGPLLSVREDKPHSAGSRGRHESWGRETREKSYPAGKGGSRIARRRLAKIE